MKVRDIIKEGNKVLSRQYGNLDFHTDEDFDFYSFPMVIQSPISISNPNGPVRSFQVQIHAVCDRTGRAAIFCGEKFWKTVEDFKAFNNLDSYGFVHSDDPEPESEDTRFDLGRI